MLKTIPFFAFFLFLSCNFIPVSVPNTTIKGSEIRSEIKKEARQNILISLSGFSSAFAAAQSANGIKQCPGFTTDTTNPGFKLPQPTEFTNVNLSGTITGIANGTVTQNWVSETITAVSYIDVRVVNTPTCLYRLNADPTTGTGTSLSSSNTIAIENVPATLNIACTTSFNSTQSLNYTISLNPRPRNLPTNFPISDQNSIFNLISEQTSLLVAGLKDDTMYTYASFEACKSNYTLTLLSYVSALPAATRSFQECGVFNPPRNSF